VKGDRINLKKNVCNNILKVYSESGTKKRINGFCILAKPVIVVQTQLLLQEEFLGC
jgi:hypothetical protein